MTGSLTYCQLIKHYSFPRIASANIGCTPCPSPFIRSQGESSDAIEEDSRFDPISRYFPDEAMLLGRNRPRRNYTTVNADGHGLPPY